MRMNKQKKEDLIMASNVETKEFKTESKRLLDLMIHSIYTNKEIFLRELISNASDAIDKYHYLSLSDERLDKGKEFEIRITPNLKDRTISIEDNGIGMTYDEINNNLGTIASSGSAEFIKKMQQAQEENKEIDIIGQFGVGFYSAFMVAKNVVVETKSPFSDKAYRFTSTGEDSYTIEEIEKEDNGTKITLFLREDSEEDNYSDFLETYKIESLVKKYSDYIRYPIKMKVTTSVNDVDEEGKEIEDKYHDVVEDKTLNSMLPLWKRNKNEVTTEELNEFYKSKFHDMEDPLIATFVNVEGNISYNALLFIPKKAPYDLYSEKYEKGLQLYTKGVFIMEKCKDLIPDYLKFVKGLVDSSDLSLNISREILQQNSELKKIATSVEKKIVKELDTLKENDFEKYQEFFKTYGSHIKWGIYENYGMKKDLLQDLLIYHSINQDKMISLKEYKEQMKEGQKAIYYASGKDKASIINLPQMDAMKKHGYDVLVLTDDIDEFTLTILREYDKVEFKSITDETLDLTSEEEKSKVEELKKEHESLLNRIKEALKGKVDDVRLSTRLVDSPVCLASSEGLSFEMEKVLNNMPNSENVKAGRILELNPNHDLLKAINKVYEDDPSVVDKYAELLFDQALLIEGLPLENPSEFSKNMCDLMIRSAK